MLNVGWKDKERESSVPDTVKEEKYVDTDMTAKMQMTGSCAKKCSLIRDIIEGGMNGKASRRRKRLRK